MSKKILFLAIALSCFFQGNAQTVRSTAANCKIRAIEVEIGGGITTGIARLRGSGFDKYPVGGAGFIEIRHNQESFPLDIGFQIRGTIFDREITRYGKTLEFSSVNLMITSDYNFRSRSDYSFFAGFGFGYVSFGKTSQIEYFPQYEYFSNYGGKEGSLCLMPRVGVELWHHLRLTASYLIEEKANRHFSLTLGVVFGGGRK